MAAAPIFRREQTADPMLDRIQRGTEETIAFIRNIPMLDGKLLDGGRGDGNGPGLTIGTGVTTFAHGLGRAVRGFQVVDLRAGVHVWRPTTEPPDPTTQMNLQASGSVTAKVWVW